MLDQSIVSNIYNTIFKNIRRTEIDLFLCGGASTAKRKSYRDRIRSLIKSEKNLAIYYPEDLFSEILARKKTDLLTLEKVLAENSDVIIIVCESPGSFTEIGAFVNSIDTCGKVVLFIQTKYKNDKSFINQGPVEYLKTHSERRTKVVYFKQDIDSTEMEVRKVLRESRLGLGKEDSRYNLSQISGQVCFIMLLLYFFDSIGFAELRDTVRSMYEIEYCKEADLVEDEERILPMGRWTGGTLEFEAIYPAAIKRLYKKGYLNKREDLGQYLLTLDGTTKAKSFLKGVEIRPLDNNKNASIQRYEHLARGRYSYVDKIRLDVLKKSYYRYG